MEFIKLFLGLFGLRRAEQQAGGERFVSDNAKVEDCGMNKQDQALLAKQLRYLDNRNDTGVALWSAVATLFTVLVIGTALLANRSGDVQVASREMIATYDASPPARL
jgi:hypothetical protein